MVPSALPNLKERYLAAVLPGIPADLPDLRTDVARFVQFPAALVEPLPIPEQDKVLLVEIGLPNSAAPFINFGEHGGQLLRPVEDESLTAVIGFNGYGDFIVLNLEAAGEVVELNHDNKNKPTVMNSGVTALLTCICCFVEWNHADGLDAFVSAVQEVDQAAAEPNAWWIREAELSLRL